ncbi:transcription factor steA protein, partial [Cladorrhinum samala]
MLSSEAQQALPHDAQVALQQVDNCEWLMAAGADFWNPVKYFLISAPVDWQADQYIRRFLLPTGEYVSCVLW